MNADYQKLKKSDSVQTRNKLETHIDAVGYGYSWMMTINGEHLEAQHKYCPPQAIALNADNYMDIIDVQITRMETKLKKDHPIKLLLWFGLQNTFPCK